MRVGDETVPDKNHDPFPLSAPDYPSSLIFVVGLDLQTLTGGSCAAPWFGSDPRGSPLEDSDGVTPLILNYLTPYSLVRPLTPVVGVCNLYGFSDQAGPSTSA